MINSHINMADYIDDYNYIISILKNRGVIKTSDSCYTPNMIKAVTELEKAGYVELITRTLLNETICSPLDIFWEKDIQELLR